jgi:hypothetical protein
LIPERRPPRPSTIEFEGEKIMKKMLMLATAALFATSMAFADTAKPVDHKSCDKAAACCKKQSCDTSGKDSCCKDQADCCQSGSSCAKADHASCKTHKS